MPYEVIGYEVSVPKDNGPLLNGAGVEVARDLVSITYGQGQVIQDRDVADHVKKQVEDEDPYVSALLKKISDSEAEDKEQASASSDSEPSAESLSDSGDEVLEERAQRELDIQEQGGAVRTVGDEPAEQEAPVEDSGSKKKGRGK